MHTGVVARREAARQLGDGSIFVSFSRQSEEESRATKHAPAAALEVANLCPLTGRRFAVLEAGAYWGAYKPVLAALQATGALASLPLGDCLMHSANTDKPPPYLGAVAPPRALPGMGARRPSLTDLAGRGGGSSHSGASFPPSHHGSQTDLARLAERALDGDEGASHGGAAFDGAGAYDIRPILNVSDQSTPHYIGDVRRDFPHEGFPGTSLDKWQVPGTPAPSLLSPSLPWSRLLSPSLTFSLLRRVAAQGGQVPARAPRRPRAGPAWHRQDLRGPPRRAHPPAQLVDVGDRRALW